MNCLQLALFLILFSRGTLGFTRCGCSQDGLSNGVQTNRPGCGLHSDTATMPTCFVTRSLLCLRSRPSREIPGAALVECAIEEALFFAAETDDVDSIVRFRELNAKLNITRVIASGPLEGEELSLVSYAAAYGSFFVVEDLLISEDYVCNRGLSPPDALCQLSDDEQCEAESPQRTAIESLIEFTYGSACIPEPVVQPVRLPSPQPARIQPLQPRPAGAFGVAEDVPSRIEGALEEAPQRIEPPRAAASVSVEALCDLYPYFVSIRSSFSSGYQHLCGGVLIANDTVLTVAHCLERIQGLYQPVVAVEARGALDTFSSCQNKPELRKAADYVLHHKWNQGEFARGFGNGQDAALIKLDRPSTKQPIEIQSSRTVQSGLQLNFLGVGQTSASSSFSSSLQISLLYTASESSCKEAYDMDLPKSIFCTDDESEFCNGDEGGPIFDVSSGVPKLVGIAHMKHPSDSCGLPGHPSLFVNVPKLKTWIKNKQKQFRAAT